MQNDTKIFLGGCKVGYISADKITTLKFQGDNYYLPSEISHFIGYSNSYVALKISQGDLKEDIHYRRLSKEEVYSLLEENADIKNNRFSKSLKNILTEKGFKYIFDNYNRINQEFPLLLGVVTRKVDKKVKFAEFVHLTDEEYQKLNREFGETLSKKMIEVLNNYKGSSGKKYKSDYLAIRNWVIQRVLDEKEKTQKPLQEESELKKIKRVLVAEQRERKSLNDDVSRLESKLEVVENELSYLKGVLEKSVFEEKKEQTLIRKMRNLFSVARKNN